MITRLALLLLLTLSFAPFAYAQEGLGEPGCRYVQDEQGKWDCAPGTADVPDVVVVTGREQASFADLVNNQIVPFIDGFVIQLLYVLAFLFFVWGVAKFFLLNNTEEGRTQGKRFVVWGLVGLVVLFSVWGIVKFLLSSVFPGGSWDGRGGAGLIPSGGRCESAPQCRSGVCILRGINTSTCE